MPHYCSNKTTTWVKSLRVGFDFHDYTVQLYRQIGCCSEAYRLYVNNQEMVDHKLTYNPFSPVCGSGGQFEFEQDGHTFLVMFDAYAWGKKNGDFCLFIDGIDVNSCLEYSAFWRRRGRQAIGLAAFLFLLAILVCVILTLVLSWSTLYLAYTGGLTGNAIYHSIAGLRLILRNPKPAADANASLAV